MKRTKFPQLYATRFSFLLCAALFLLSACIETNPLTGRKRLYGLSWAQEQQFGQQSNQRLLLQYAPYADPQLQAYVTQVGQSVVAQSDLRKPSAPPEYRNLPFTFQILDTPLVNAFAVPGGYIYITRGLLAHLENEAQLALVLGHEVGHIAARHVARQALQVQVGQTALAVGSNLGAQALRKPETASQLMALGSALFHLLYLQFSRSDETEADQLSVQYAQRLGYDASQGAGFFASLKRLNQQGTILPTFLSTHPDPGNRMQNIVKLADQYRTPGQALAINRDQYLQRVDGLVLGQNPRTGFLFSNTFYHPGLGFQFSIPLDWNAQSQIVPLTLVEPRQQAVILFGSAYGRSAWEAAALFAQSQGLQVLYSAPTQINGFNAVFLGAQSYTTQGSVSVVDYFVEFDGKVFSFLGYAAASQPGVLSLPLQQALGSFRRITEPRILNLQPARIGLIAVQHPAPLSRFVPTGSTGGLTLEDVAILNQLSLTQTLDAGTILKIPHAG